MISIRKIIPIVTLLTLLACTIFSTGCFEEYQAPAMDLLGNVVVLKGSSQYCTQYPEQCVVTTPAINSAETCSVNSTASSCAAASTPIITPTPTPEPTIIVEPTTAYQNINPFSAGERWQGQWFRWQRLNVSGRQSVNRGIVVYGHSYHDAFTVWDNDWGNYIPILPPAGYRFLAVYVHQEDFGPDTGLWAYDASYFHLQYNQNIYEEWKEYDKVDRIIELEDSHSDYYNIDRLKPYAINRIYIGKGHASTGGYYYEDLWALRTGQGNSWDGYIIYLVPVSIKDSDIRIVCNFAGDMVNWRFDRTDVIMPVAEVPRYHTPLPTTPPISYGKG